MRYFQRGRDALAFGLIANVRRKGTVLFPAYFCEPSVAGVRAAGFGVGWMDVCDDLSFGLDRLAERLDSGNIVAVVVCDFFGWSSQHMQRVVELARERQILVIRDCCHSALSWQSEQFQADLTVFSFRKTLPVWDGGALVGCGSSASDTSNASPLAMDVRREVIRILERVLGHVGIINPYPFLDFVRRASTVASAEPGKLYDEIRPSRSLMRWLDSAGALHEVARARRENFLFLQKALCPSGLNSFFSVLGEHDVPQVFPLKTPHAGSLVKFLRSRGVGAVRWPGNELPSEVLASPETFPVANKMNDLIACLPLHQDLGRRELEKMAALVNMWSGAGH
ncbi:MAG: DegT/DnrJ/EryC1/StrS family aminotransferase [Gallionella sp.]|nr:DegT/DnrJ/EryC1/StrS family aminotransferase [Gallionella sp.]